MKKIYKKYCLAVPAAVIILASIAGICFAYTLNLPIYNGTGTTYKVPGFPEYVSLIISVVWSGAAAIVVLAFIAGAVVYMTSAGNPTASGNGTGMMVSSIYGAILLFASVIIINTINPTIITTTLGPVQGPDLGLFYVDGSGNSLGNALPAMGDVSQAPAGATRLQYKCGGNEMPKLLVHEWPQINFTGTNTNTEELPCEKSIQMSSAFASYTTTSETPGVYFFAKACPNPGGGSPGGMLGYSEGPFTTDQIFTEPLASQIKAVWIVNDSANDYGVFLHQGADFTGRCVPGGRTQNPFISRTCPLTNAQPGGQCFPISAGLARYGSATIFKFNDCNYKTSGDGVTFYSHNFGFKAGAKAGNYTIGNSDKAYDIGNLGMAYSKMSPADIKFDYTGVSTDLPPGEEDRCKSFADCQGSLGLSGGNYRVVLVAQDASSSVPEPSGVVSENDWNNYLASINSQNYYCAVFKDDFGDFNDYWLLTPQNGVAKVLSSVYVFPVAQ